MTTADLLKNLESSGVVVKVTDAGKLVLDGSDDSLTDAVVADILANRDAVIWQIRARAERA